MPGAVENRGAGFGWTREPPSGWHGDARGLAEALTRELGPHGVRFDAGERALYATDASNYRQVPIGVVRPRDAGEVEAALALCRRFGAPVLGRGGGTSLAGQCCNVAVVLDFSRHMNRVLEIDPERRLARVEPGAVLDDLRRETWKAGLTFGPDPATHAQCTLGGMIGNNSCGVHSVMAGRTADNVRSLDVLTYDGARFAAEALSDGELANLAAGTDRRAEIVRALMAIRDRYGDLVRERYPRIPRRVSGYNLDELLPENGFHLGRFLVGSEGTLALTLEATLELVPWPAARVVLAAGFADVYAAADAVPAVLETGPIGLEGFDDRLVREQRVKLMNPVGLELLPPGGASDGGWLLIELGADTREEAVARAERARQALTGVPGLTGTRLLVEAAEQAAVWVVRESALGATAKVPGRPDMWEGWEDSAVPPERMGDYLRDLRKLYERYGYEGSFYGHFGEGCLHTRTSFDLESKPGIAAFRDFVGEAAELVVGYGGSISGEHGDGQARGELLPLQFGDELCRAFSEVKRAWDPGNRMNPGKLAEPYPVVSNLRLDRSGRDHRPWEPATAFRFPHDDGRFSKAAGRCVGVGKCRREEGGVMCPSYRATREERHSTRGRARLLFELLEGEAIAPSWRSDEVEDALSLCLSCKGCKTECPVNVDMATYKAEFLHHCYRRRLRPRAAYAMGLVHWWARLAAIAPRLVNAVARGRWTGALTKKLAGVAPERTLPAFAAETFRAGFRRRGEAAGAGRRAILWTDTFDDHFQPDVAWAAVEVLEAAGFAVEIPAQILCCGRPLYDHGMLDLARRQLRKILDALGPALREGAPVVVLEPSCLAVFRDELPNLMPDDEGARKLAAQSVTLAELLERHAPDWSPPQLAAKALVHAHCHHRAVLGFDADLRLLDRLGLDYHLLDSGCCGMAGAFGYEAGEKARVAAAVGELVLLPAVRAAEPDTLIVTDGFSCRSQIAQGTGREPLHLAQVLQMALRAT